MMPSYSYAMKQQTRQSYIQRIERASAYLIDHLDDDLDIHRLAEEATFSAYHFHRIYCGVTGETVHETLRRMRLHRAAVRLISSETLSVAEIACEAHYASVQAFSRAFRLAYGMPATTYRETQSRQPNGAVLKRRVDEDPDLQQQFKEMIMPQITIEQYEPVRVAALAHLGDYMDIGNTFERLNIWAGANNLLSEGVRSFGIYYDDPAAVAKDELRSDACLAVADDVTPPTPYRITHTPAGRCAALLHVGPYSDLERAYQWLYGVWLPQSGEEPADLPSFEEYLNDPRQVAPSELRTAICLPLKG
jgi:AraC family transcriptional regulator